MLKELIKGFYAGSSEDAVKKITKIVLSNASMFLRYSKNASERNDMEATICQMMAEEIYSRKHSSIDELHMVLMKRLSNTLSGKLYPIRGVYQDVSPSYGMTSYVVDSVLFLLYANWKVNFRNRLIIFESYEKKPYFPLSKEMFIYCAKKLEKDFGKDFDKLPFIFITSEEEYDLIEDFLRESFERDKEAANFPNYSPELWYSTMENISDGILDKMYNGAFDETETIKGINGVIRNYTGSSSNIEIEEGVKSIGGFVFGEDLFEFDESDMIDGTMSYKAFSDNESIINVWMPDSVEKIGECSFSGCINLRKVELSKELRTIEKKAFFKCEMLSELVLPSSIKRIDDMAFCGCKSLGKVRFDGRMGDLMKVAISPSAFDFSLMISCKDGSYAFQAKKKNYPWVREPEK